MEFVAEYSSERLFDVGKWCHERWKEVVDCKNCQYVLQYIFIMVLIEQNHTQVNVDVLYAKNDK